MCTYLSESVELHAAAKGGGRWFTVTRATASVDHPSYSTDEHTLNLDFRNEAGGPAARVAVEVPVGEARRLLACLEVALAAFEGVAAG